MTDAGVSSGLMSTVKEMYCALMPLTGVSDQLPTALAGERQGGYGGPAGL